MAITLKITNGDVELNTSTGRPKMIGNNTGEDILAKAKEKTSQDMRRSLSINRIRSGTGAGITELVGIIQDAGFISTRVLLQQQINSMFNSIIRLQNLRTSVRPKNERFSDITLFRILPDISAKVSFKFTLDVTTVGGNTINQSGTVIG